MKRPHEQHDQYRIAGVLWTSLVCTLVLLSVLAGASGGAAADPGGVLSDVDADETCEDALITTACKATNYASGLVDRALDLNPLRSNDPTAAEAADDIQTTFTTHNESIEAWINQRTTASTDADTLKLTIQLDDERATVYVLGDVTDGNYTNARAVQSTDREPDGACTLEANAARNASDELDTFAEEYANPGDDLSREHMRYLVGRYGGNVHCDFLDT